MNFITHLFRIMKYGTSYAIATGFFPKEIAKKVLLLYSFVRIPDNIVDDIVLWRDLKSHYLQAKKILEEMQHSRIQAYMANNKANKQWSQYISLFQDNGIPFQYSLDFFKAMIDDCSVHRYETYEQLEWYMYGSASVVWLVMCHLIWFTDPKDEQIAKEYATELGNAMQLTNFLRDVREDYEELGRIYMPLDVDYFVPSINGHCEGAIADEAINTVHNNIISFCHWWYVQASEEKKKERSDYMKILITKCRTMYAHSLDGLQYLKPEWREAVRLAALLYGSILDKIESNNYDVFTKSARTNLRDKLKILYTYKSRWTK